jgi:hypothetical protein
MIVLDAYKRDTVANTPVTLLANNGVQMQTVEPDRDYTAAGIIPSTYTEDCVKFLFQAEAGSVTDNYVLRAMQSSPATEMAFVVTDFPFVEPQVPTRYPLPELPSTWGLNVEYYPLIYGVVSLTEIRPVQGCDRSLWEVLITETRKIKPPDISWDGAPKSEFSTFTTKAVTNAGSSVVSSSTLYVPPVGLVWYRLVVQENNRTVADTGVKWL